MILGVLVLVIAAIIFLSFLNNLRTQIIAIAKIERTDPDKVRTYAAAVLFALVLAAFEVSVLAFAGLHLIGAGR